MPFSVSKCHVLSVCKKEKQIYHDYILIGQILEHVVKAKCLSVQIKKDLTWGWGVGVGWSHDFRPADPRPSDSRPMKTTIYLTFAPRLLH